MNNCNQPGCMKKRWQNSVNCHIHSGSHRLWLDSINTDIQTRTEASTSLNITSSPNVQQKIAGRLLSTHTGNTSFTAPAGRSAEFFLHLPQQQGNESYYSQNPSHTSRSVDLQQNSFQFQKQFFPLLHNNSVRLINAPACQAVRNAGQHFIQQPSTFRHSFTVPESQGPLTFRTAKQPQVTENKKTHFGSSESVSPSFNFTQTKNDSNIRDFAVFRLSSNCKQTTVASAEQCLNHLQRQQMQKTDGSGSKEFIKSWHIPTKSTSISEVNTNTQKQPPFPKCSSGVEPMSSEGVARVNKGSAEEVYHLGEKSADKLPAVVSESFHSNCARQCLTQEKDTAVDKQNQRKQDITINLISSSEESSDSEIDSDEDCIVLDFTGEEILNEQLAFNSNDLEQTVKDSAPKPVPSTESSRFSTHRTVLEKNSDFVANSNNMSLSNQATVCAMPSAVVQQIKTSSKQQEVSFPQPDSAQDTSELKILETVSLCDQAGSSVPTTRAKSLREMSSESYYRCTCFDGRCSFRTLIPTQLELHFQEVHQQDDVYLCVHCGSQEMGGESLMHHLEQHVCYKAWSFHCSDVFCTFISQCPQKLLEHMATCHSDCNNHICWQCNTKFDSLQQFSAHVKQNLLIIFSCLGCSAKDVNQKTVLMHINSSHPYQTGLTRSVQVMLCRDRKIHCWEKKNALFTKNNNYEYLVLPDKKNTQSMHEQSSSVKNTNMVNVNFSGGDLGSPLGSSKTSAHSNREEEEDELLKHDLEKFVVNLDKTDALNNTDCQEMEVPDAVNDTDQDVGNAQLFSQHNEASLDNDKSKMASVCQDQHKELAINIPPHQSISDIDHETEALSTNKFYSHSQIGSESKHAQRGLKDSPAKNKLKQNGADQCKEAELLTDQSSNSWEIKSVIDKVIADIQSSDDVCQHELEEEEITTEHVYSEDDTVTYYSASDENVYSEDDTVTYYSASDGSKDSGENGMDNTSETKKTDFINTRLLEKSYRKHLQTEEPESDDSVTTSHEEMLNSSIQETRLLNTERTSGEAATLCQLSTPSTGRKQSKPPFYNCKLCNFAGGTVSMLRKHIYASHKDEMKCPKCGCCPANDEKFYQHLHAKHFMDCRVLYQKHMSLNWITPRPYSKSRNSVAEKDHKKCKSAENISVDSANDSKMSNRRASFSRHGSRNTIQTIMKKLFYCKLCLFVTITRKSIVKHLFHQHPQVQCTACEMKVCNIKALKCHLKMQHPSEQIALYNKSKPSNWFFADSRNKTKEGTVQNSSVSQDLTAQNSFSPPDTVELNSSNLLDTEKQMASIRLNTEKKSASVLLNMEEQNSSNLLDAEEQTFSNMQDTKPVNSFVLSGTKKQNYSQLDTEKQNSSILLGIEEQNSLLPISKRSTVNVKTTCKSTDSDPLLTSSTIPSFADVFATPQSFVSFVPEAKWLSNSTEMSFSLPVKDNHYLHINVNSEMPANLLEQGIPYFLLTKTGFDDKDKEYRCPHCIATLKKKLKFYEHIAYHYHYRCFACVYCSFRAFALSAVVNHSKKTHAEPPDVRHLIKDSFEERIQRAFEKAFVDVSAPFTEKRLLALERARQKKMNGKKLKIDKKLQRQVKKVLKKKINVQKQKINRPLKKKKTTSYKYLKPGVDWLMCPYCRADKKPRYTIEVEIRYHIHYKPFCCPHCQLSSGSKIFLIRHLASTHPTKSQTVKVIRDDRKENKFKMLFKKAVSLSKVNEVRRIKD